MAKPRIFNDEEARAIFDEYQNGDGPFRYSYCMDKSREFACNESTIRLVAKGLKWYSFLHNPISERK